MESWTQLFELFQLTYIFVYFSLTIKKVHLTFVILKLIRSCRIFNLKDNFSHGVIYPIRLQWFSYQHQKQRKLL